VYCRALEDLALDVVVQSGVDNEANNLARARKGDMHATMKARWAVFNG
jgi:hypothetical protein